MQNGCLLLLLSYVNCKQLLCALVASVNDVKGISAYCVISVAELFNLTWNKPRKSASEAVRTSNAK